MKNNVQELLTHEVYIRDDAYYISIPVNNLIEPRFLIKKNTLFIFLYNYSQSYMIKNITDEVLDAIKAQNCYLLENLHQETLKKHPIRLFP